MTAINKYLFFLLIGGATLATSCKKGLDLKPSDSIIEENAFTNIASLERGLTGAYATFNGAYDNEIWATVLYTDEAMLPSENNTGRGVTTFRWQVDPGTTDVTAAWGSYYFGIDRANRILAASEKLTGADAAEETSKSRIRGEALALRAFGHLQLLINFSNSYSPDALSVPYMEQSVTSKPQRLTVAQVLAKIKADLDVAKTLIPASYNIRTRITLPAVHAIQARAALYGKNWDDAIAAATAAINAVPLATRTKYPEIWTDKTTDEVIWKQRREVGQTAIGNLFYDRSQKIITYAPSKELRQTFDVVNDIRYASTVRELSATRFRIGKYIGGDAANENLADIKIFRTAEMYLIRAEAYAQKGMLAEGAADLNALRAARLLVYVPQVFASKQALIDAITEERFKELAFEAQRMGDLRRQQLPVTRLAEDAVNAFGAVTLNPADKEYYYPIPASEILANENMQQNPAYQ